MKFAKILGKHFAEEILSTPREKQNWRPFLPNDEIPPGDYRALRDFYGTVGDDVIKAYKTAFNVVLNKEEVKRKRGRKLGGVMKEYHGYYNEWGYRIFDDGGDEVYNAGNSPYESSGVIALENGLPLITLKEYCKYTGKMIARDNNGKWLGCKRYRG